MTSLNIWDSLATAMDAVGVLIGVVSIATGLLTLLVVLWGLRKLVTRLRETQHLVANWPRAQARITAVNNREFRLGDSVIQRDHADYVFSDASGREFEGTDVEPVLRQPVVGGELEVTYDPADPTTSHPTARMGSRIAGWAVLFAVVLLVLTGLAGMLVWVGVDAIA